MPFAARHPSLKNTTWEDCKMGSQPGPGVGEGQGEAGQAPGAHTLRRFTLLCPRCPAPALLPQELPAERAQKGHKAFASEREVDAAATVGLYSLPGASCAPGRPSSPSGEHTCTQGHPPAVVLPGRACLGVRRWGETDGTEHSPRGPGVCQGVQLQIYIPKAGSRGDTS